MSTFAYEARDRMGKLTGGTVEADSPSLAAAKLREIGLYITNLRRREESSRGQARISFGGGIKPRDIAILTKQWSVMIRAGLNMLTCLRTLIMQTQNQKLKTILTQVRQDVEAGQSLAGALGKHPKAFSAMFAHMIEAGEASGQLETVLERLADHAEREYALRRKIIGALTYPAVIICVVFAVTGFLITFIVPQFAKLFEEFGKQLPPMTRLVIAVSNLIKGYWWLMLLSAAGAVVFFSRWRRTANGKYAIDRFLYRLPIFGPVIQKVAVSRFTRTFGTLIESGVSIVPSLEIVERAVSNAVISRAIAQARISISQGQGMARPLAETGVFPPMLTEMVAVGEETGALEKMLNQVADFYDSEVETAIGSLTSMIEPMVVVLLGGVVGFIVVSIVLPMLDISSVVGG